MASGDGDRLVGFPSTDAQGREAAVGVFGQVGTRGGERAGAAAHADCLVFTAPALAAEPGVVPQVIEDAAAAPNVRERSCLHVAGTERQVAAGEDVAAVRD